MFVFQGNTQNKNVPNFYTVTGTDHLRDEKSGFISRSRKHYALAKCVKKADKKLKLTCFSTEIPHLSNVADLAKLERVRAHNDGHGNISLN